MNCAIDAPWGKGSAASALAVERGIDFPLYGVCLNELFIFVNSLLTSFPEDETILPKAAD